MNAGMSEAGAALSGGTAVLGVIGQPIAHSLSPLIHNLWLAQYAIPAVYVAFPANPRAGAASTLFPALFDAGIVGLNVTAPLKEAAFEGSAAAGMPEQRLRAVNVLVRGDAGWVGHNTDREGFLRALREERAARGLGASLAGLRTVILGAGGAARACALAMQTEGALLHVLARDPASGRFLRDQYGAEIAGLAEASRVLDGAGLVINCLPASAKGVVDTLPWNITAPTAMAAELAYSASGSPFLARARQAGRAGFDGLGMLLHQAALSFSLWWGRVPDIAPARMAALAALGRVS